MNNLLRTLTESNARPQTDLRLLLTTVREGRKQSVDNKLSDSFYDALEGLLLDLKAITLDNRDAEAFLKPVSKAEVPDYYDVIANPMDFQTMVKKVKQKQYKSKREFKDDLELIWSNCYTYNASENHPLRQCVKRLKAKADRLLKHVTDRRERTDPFIPPELGAGYFPRINGASRTHTRSPSYSSIKGGTPGSTILKHSPSLSRQSTFRLDVPFPESPAITRTPEGMAAFYELDREVAGALKKPNQKLVQQLKDLAPIDGEGQDDVDMASQNEEETTESDGIVGDKRKQSSPPNDSRPRKRARFVTPYSTPDGTKDELSELWWTAAQSDTLLANGVPPIPFGPASSEHKARRPPLPSSPSSSSSIPKSKPKPKRRKKNTPEVDEVPPTHIDNPNALLNMMNTNIKTMRRVRHTHTKFAALNATTLANEDVVEGGGSAPVAGPSGSGAGFDGGGESSTMGLKSSADDEILNEKVDEKPWVMMMQRKVKGKGKEKAKMTLARVGGVEVGECNAWGCMQWANQKILEHIGFQGTSQIALDVLAGVMSEYLSNVGRTIKYLCDKRPVTMTPEEIVLHTLFESGTSKVQDLERYIRDDVERYASRLNELEKKIVGAYRETTAGETLEDEGLFEDEDEEEAGALAIGEFADLLGEDYLGLRELGIAQEFGMSTLSIPKKLLKSKKNQLKPAAVKPSEPPPPYPPPPPFVQLASNKLDDQIGLLKPYYQNRFMSLATAAASAVPPPPPSVPALPGPSLPGPVIGIPLPGPTLAIPALPGPSLSQTPQAPVPGLPSTNSIMVRGAASTSTSAQPGVGQGQQAQPIDLASLPGLTLPDDAPTAVQARMGPLGQILKGGGAGGSGKKKSKGAGASAGNAGQGAASAGGGGGGGGGQSANVNGVGTSTAPGSGVGSVPPTTIVDGNASPKKKKGGATTTGAGTGNGRKKKGPGDGSGGSTGGQGSSPPYPPVVVASA